jgi:hypothetical protein
MRKNLKKTNLSGLRIGKPWSNKNTRLNRDSTCLTSNTASLELAGKINPTGQENR